MSNECIAYLEDILEAQLDAAVKLGKVLELLQVIPPLPPPPEPPKEERPAGWVRVTEDKCHLRAINHLDGAGKAVWQSYPKGSDNPGRDRYLAYRNNLVEVYLDGKFLRAPYRGAFPGTGGNHGWEVVPGQVLNGHTVSGLVKLYILCKDATRV